MFIAHLPAGYLLTTRLQTKLQTRGLLWLGLLASVTPDFDLAYFYFLDQRQTLHHAYWTHIPAFWFFILAVALLLGFFIRKAWYRPAVIIFFANIFLHFVLDTFVAGIKWVYPVSLISLRVFQVPAMQDLWILNFILHWTFALELLILIWASIEISNKLIRRRL